VFKAVPPVVLLPGDEVLYARCRVLEIYRSFNSLALLERIIAEKGFVS
jgi:hypothetical protein